MRRVTISTLCTLAVLAVVTGTMPAAADPTGFQLPSVTSACGTYVRWVITADRTGGESGLIQAAEVTLLSGGVPVPKWGIDSEIVVTNPGGESGDPTEGPEKAYDGSSDTKWLDFAFGDSESTLLIRFPEAVTFDSYRWTTGNDVPGRDPISWRVEVSSDGVAWITVDTRSDVGVTEEPPRTTDVGPFEVTSSGCGTSGKDFGGGRSDGAKSGPGANRDSVLPLDPRSRGRVK